MFIKYLSVFPIVLLSFGLASCSGADTQKDKSSDTESDSSTSSGWDTSSDTDTIEEFACLSAEPSAVSVQVDSELRIIGTGLPSQIAMVLKETTTDAVIDLGTLETVTNHAALIPVTAGKIPEGTYEVTITNPADATEASVCPTALGSLDLAPQRSQKWPLIQHG